MTVFDWLFAAVCGQNSAHTWAPAGESLPCCQRCTGLYAGAFYAAVLHLLLRPRLTGRFLEIHGLFLLVMVPFGYHWLPQGPVLRTVTGLLFGAGLVSFLMVFLPSSNPLSCAGNPSVGRVYFMGLAATGALTVVAAASGLRGASMAITLLVSAGTLTLLVLFSINAVLYASAFARWCLSSWKGQNLRSSARPRNVSPVLAQDRTPPGR